MKLSKLVGQTGILGAGLFLVVSFGASCRKSATNVNNDNNVVRSAPFASCVNLDKEQPATRVKMIIYSIDYLAGRMIKSTRTKKPVANKCERC